MAYRAVEFVRSEQALTASVSRNILATLQKTSYLRHSHHAGRIENKFSYTFLWPAGGYHVSFRPAPCFLDSYTIERRTTPCQLSGEKIMGTQYRHLPPLSRRNTPAVCVCVASNVLYSECIVPGL